MNHWNGYISKQITPSRIFIFIFVCISISVPLYLFVDFGIKLREITNKYEMVEMGFSPTQVMQVFGREPDIKWYQNSKEIWYFLRESKEIENETVGMIDSINELPNYYSAAFLVFSQEPKAVVLKVRMDESLITTKWGEYEPPLRNLPEDIKQEVFGFSE